MPAKKKRATPTPAPAAKKRLPAKPGAKPAAEPNKKLSALDAAARVLRETGQATSCPELIAQMATKGYWTSPKGQTPSATLYTAVTMLPNAC
jgi:hypothetical protein